jgi:hypothetical protein
MKRIAPIVFVALAASIGMVAQGRRLHARRSNDHATPI